jgi:hypothetical protein
MCPEEVGVFEMRPEEVGAFVSGPCRTLDAGALGRIIKQRKRAGQTVGGAWRNEADLELA